MTTTLHQRLTRFAAVAAIALPTFGAIALAEQPSKANTTEASEPTMPEAPAVPSAAQASLAQLGLTPQTLPIIDGSTSTQPLAMLLGATAVDVPMTWRIHDMLLMLRPVEEGPQSNSMFGRVQLRRTHGSYVALIENKADLILVAREPSEDELTLAAERGVELDVQPVARDALIFIVNDQNPVDSLTLEQVRSVFRGEINNWSQLGGEDAPIHGLTRNPNSGSQELMNKLVMKGDAMTPRMTTFPGMRIVIDTTRVDPHAIGYTIYYYQRYMMPEPAHIHGSGWKGFVQPNAMQDDESPSPGWKPLAIDGIGPTPATIGDRSYPLTEPVYVVVRKGDAADAPAVRLRDWLLTDDGQQLVKASGYMPYRAVE